MPPKFYGDSLDVGFDAISAQQTREIKSNILFESISGMPMGPVRRQKAVTHIKRSIELGKAGSLGWDRGSRQTVPLRHTRASDNLFKFDLSTFAVEMFASPIREHKILFLFILCFMYILMNALNVGSFIRFR